MMQQSTRAKYNKLLEWFLNYDRVAVALSGGVDSAVVALVAKKALANNAIAITADYKTLSAEEMNSAKKVSKEIGIEHIIIEYNELENPQFVKNDELRCYHCRTELGRHLVNEAQKHGIKVIVDGTNTDDLNDIRPGIKAIREYGIKSPLVDAEIEKKDVREIAFEYNLSIYDKPSNSCLASRIPHGFEVTFEKLKRIEESELVVKRIFNVRQVRVRDHDGIARIEVGKDELVRLFDIDKLALVDNALKQLGFKFVSIDAKGYRTGNLVVTG